MAYLIKCVVQSRKRGEASRYTEKPLLLGIAESFVIAWELFRHDAYFNSFVTYLSFKQPEIGTTFPPGCLIPFDAFLPSLFHTKPTFL